LLRGFTEPALTFAFFDVLLFIAQMLAHSLVRFLLKDAAKFSQPSLRHFASQFGEFLFGCRSGFAVNPIGKLLHGNHGFTAPGKLTVIDRQTMIMWNAQKRIVEFLYPLGSGIEQSVGEV
jgi:hypothetical protein